MNIESRIKQYPACEAIDLTEPEKNIYSGAGWKLARFENGLLAEFFDPGNLPYLADPQEAADQAVEAATAWLANVNATGAGEVWLVMCSCCQLCEPRRIRLDDASALAHMARVIGEQFAEFDND